MGTNIRTELSKSNKYWISKHRRLELTHFCLQYPEWEKMVNDAIFYPKKGDGIIGGNTPDITGNTAVKIYEIKKNMDMVKNVCFEADNTIYQWLFLGVTRGFSFNYLKLHYDIPCEKNMYYDRYKKFFYLLDKVRKS